ncbi:MAG TPA: chloride channel protein [Gemmatimonadales bacterium]|jgi:H+/Cl- antiporter ClcA/CBS domain-containing protein
MTLPESSLDTAIPPGESNSQKRLGDFTVDTRLLIITPMAAVVGVLSALVAVALVWLIGSITNLVYYHRWSSHLVSPAENTLGLGAVLVPMVGGLIIGLMARYGSEKIRGHGIPEAMEAILIGRSRMSAKVALLKPLSSAISIGTGGPFGAEGPIIMTGGAFGSLFAQAFHLSAAERKTLLVAGAAGGMAAIFATPLAAVLLAVELLLFEWKPRSFIPVAASAAVAAALRVPLLGQGPIFPVTPHAALSWDELLMALAVGLAAGFGSGLLTWLVYSFEDLFAKLPIHFMWWPVIGGLFVGLGGLFFPRALGVGYDTIGDLLNGRLVGSFLIGLAITKALIWAIALGSGTSGGVLAPLLIMGGALGAVEAHWIHLGDTGLWAMISMAAIMGGTMRSPLTAVAFMLELTNDILVLPALLIGCVAAQTVTVLLMRRSILTEKVARRGYHVMREYIVNPLSRSRVEDVMQANAPTLRADMTVDALSSLLARHDPTLAEQYAWPILDSKGILVGIVTRGDLVRAASSGVGGDRSVLEAGSRSLVVTYPDELLEEAVDKMVRHDIGRLPVVDRHHPDRLVGYLGRKGIASAWREIAEEEQVREAGWLSGRARLLRMKVRRVISQEDDSERLVS